MVRILVPLALTLAALPVWAQTTAPAPLPPEAQAAVDKGVLAAKDQDYLLAIRYFQDARKLAPQAPEIYYDLGLAESKIPGRELRAIAWFGAFLSASPNASNFAAVKGEIDRLDVKSQGNNVRLIKTVQGATNQTNKYNTDVHLTEVANLWLVSGDLAAALRMANFAPSTDIDDIAKDRKSQMLTIIARGQAKLGDTSGAQTTFALALQTSEQIESVGTRNSRLQSIATDQANAGDIVGAEKTVDLIQDKGDFYKGAAEASIAIAQAKVGDFAGGQRTVIQIQNSRYRDLALYEIASDQIEAGDIAGAEKSFDGMHGPDLKDPVLVKIALAKAEAGDNTGALKIASVIQNADTKNYLLSTVFFQHPERYGPKSNAGTTSSPVAAGRNPRRAVPSVIAASDWLNKLDESAYGDCALNAPLFLDLASYLKSLPPSGNPESAFANLRDTALKVVTAQNVIDKMLKQQAMQ